MKKKKVICVKAVSILNIPAGKYKNARLMLQKMANSLDTISHVTDYHPVTRPVKITVEFIKKIPTK